MAEDPAPGTPAYEERLPRVPLPTLEDSAARFLEWCAPLLTAEQLAQTQQAVTAFLAPDSPAHALQAALQDYDGRPDVDSWLDDFWRQRYLGRRDRIALNANFFFLLQDAPLGQVERAAQLVCAALRYRARLERGQLPAPVQRGRPLSTARTRFLFSTTRVPSRGQDTLRSPEPGRSDSPPRRRAVTAGTSCASTSSTQDGDPLAPDALAAGLRAVLALTAEPAPPGTAVGHLTAQDREQWATDRQALLDVDPANRSALDVVETALFCVCLEDGVPQDVHAACDLLLHGDSADRWFDRSLSFVVFADGRAGLNCEHAELDGTTVLALVEALAEPADRRREPRRRRPSRRAARVDFVLDAPLRAAVERAASDFAAYAAATATAVLSFPGVGTDRVKALGASPDAFWQLAYQLAHARTRGVGATYESIATRHFRSGRTEAMRVVTPEVLSFVQAMDAPDADARRRAFSAAATAHVERAGQCQQGAAPEQHLWELQMRQQRRDPSAPPLALYDSPGWTVLRDDQLSTSSAPSRHISHFGFGSTTPRCIGIAYVLLPDRCNLLPQHGEGRQRLPGRLRARARPSRDRARRAAGGRARLSPAGQSSSASVRTSRPSAARCSGSTRPNSCRVRSTEPTTPASLL